MSEFRTRFTVAPDLTRIAWHEIGDAEETLVLIQGLGMPGRVWDALAVEIAAQGFRVILPDNRGVGLSSVPTPPYDLPTMADDVRAVLDAANVERPLIAGSSMGGMIAQHFALRHAARLSGLLLISTTCGLPHGKFLNPQAIRLLLKTTLMARRANEEDFIQLLLHQDNAHRFDDFFGRLEEVFRETPTRRRAYLGHLLAATRHSTGGRLHQIALPTRVVAGEDDFLIPPANSEIIASKIPGARLRFVDGAGHVLPFERPDALIDEILALRSEVDR